MAVSYHLAPQDQRTAVHQAWPAEMASLAAPESQNRAWPTV